jgi:dephospho-CoA kinase
MRMNIGLTGGMGCGKSTTLRLFGERGWDVFEADACVRSLLAEDPEVREAVAEGFGHEVMANDGTVDRAALARIVFAHSSKLDQLEAILHPRVRAAWQRKLNEGLARLVVEIPLLFEKSLASLFDVTVCVASSPSVQQKRLRERGLEDDQIQQRLARQWPLTRKMEAADHVLLNDGSLAHLESQIDFLVCQWKLPSPSS